jgi:hypothetical protein
LLVGYPLLIIAIPGLLFILYHKFAGFSRKDRALGKWSSLRQEISWDFLLVLIAWFIGVFGLYLTYEWTADFQGAGGFVIFDRFYLPGLFPLVVIVALILARFPLWIDAPITLAVVAFGSIVYAQWALNLNILPNWVLNGNGMRGPGGGRPGNLPNGNFPGGGPPPGGNFPGGFRPPGQ